MSSNRDIVGIVKTFAAGKKTSRGEKITFNSFDERKFRDIQRDRLKNAAEIMVRLGGVSALADNFNRNDFRELEEKINRALR